MKGRFLALFPLLGALLLASPVGPLGAGTAFAGDTPPGPAAGPASSTQPPVAPGAGATPAASAQKSASDAADEEERQASEYNRELRTVEQDVDRLKERVFRSKATLELLKELVLEGASQGSQVVIWHMDKLGSGYSLQSIQYFLDGKNIFAKTDPTGGLDSAREIKLLQQALPPGTHNLNVNMVLRGNGFGVFSYLQTYSFKVTSSFSFKVEDGRQTTVRVTAGEKGGALRSYVDRPNVTYAETSTALKQTADADAEKNGK